MSRPNPVILFVFLLVLILGLGGSGLLKGGFFIAKHEGDTLHLLQIVFRMADGEWPHLDFMTPIGVLAFAPIVLFVEMGVGIGKSILLSQILVALVLLPALYWACLSRFEAGLAYLFGFVVLVLTLALVHGEADRSVSISMHYNRWAWAVSYVVILLAVLPARTPARPTLDGVFIGVGMAALALCKVTYFAAFAPPVLVALLLRGALDSLKAATVSGLVVAGVVTALAGPAFWSAYVDNLMTVAGSDVRAQPGPPLKTVIGAPAYLGGSLTLLAGVILLRQAGAQTLGLVLMLLVPGFFYVTFQNFANDPQWLMLLAFFLLAPSVRPELQNALGWNMRHALGIGAAMAIAFAAPSMLNLAYSPFRHLSQNVADYQAMLRRMPGHIDLRVRVVRSNQVDGRLALDVPGSGLEGREEAARRDETRTSFLGEVLPDCELQQGFIGWFETIVADIEAAGLGGADKRVFAADIFSSGHWLFGNLGRLDGGAPWYYGGLPGFGSADYLLVPMCPNSPSVRKEILEGIAATDAALTELRRTPLYALYGIVRSGG